MNSDKNAFLTFCKTISRLRAENGCPWDQKQTIRSLKKYLQEECDELLDAMDSDDPDHLCEEIGDVLFILVLLSEISSESGHFTLNDAITGIEQKMIRRHPHVFADAIASSDEELKAQWEKIKSQEKRKKTN
jgi:MazG family protein